MIFIPSVFNIFGINSMIADYYSLQPTGNMTCCLWYIQLNPIQILAIRPFSLHIIVLKRCWNTSWMAVINMITHIFFLRPFFPLVSLLFFPTAMMDRGSSRRGQFKPRSGANLLGWALTTWHCFSNMADAAESLKKNSSVNTWFF